MDIMVIIIRSYKPYITLSPGHQLTANQQKPGLIQHHLRHRWMDQPTVFYQLAKVI